LLLKEIIMTDINQPKRLTGALVSGVIYLDEQNRVQDAHWCMTADGDDAPADIQPVIRTGSFDTAGQILPEMLAELADRFARAAAAEAAKAARSKKKAAHDKPAPVPAVSQTAAVEDAPEEIPDGAETETLPAQEVKEPAQPETPSGGEQAGEKPASTPAPAKPAVAKLAEAAPASSTPSLFDGLDLS
jgi:hypothetical protein